MNVNKKGGEKMTLLYLCGKNNIMSPREQAFFAEKNEGEQMKEKMGLKKVWKKFVFDLYNGIVSVRKT